MPTRIEVTPDGVRFRQEQIAARPLRSGVPGLVRVALVATQALLLAGDRVRIEVDVRGPVAVELVETAGTVAYDMRGGSASWEVDVRLDGGARLTWLGEPFVVAAGASVTRSTTLDLAEGAVATLRESLVLGRTGESGGALSVRTRATYAGAPLLVEDLDLTPEARSGPAVLGGRRCLDSITRLGDRLPEGPGVLQLAGPGSVARWIGDEQHRSGMDRLLVRPPTVAAGT
jgi:urease accessory protein